MKKLMLLNGKVCFQSTVKSSNSFSDINAAENQTASTIKSDIESTGDNTFDALDRLFAGKQNAGRKYRGFYFDADVLSIIDSVESGSKSEFVNEALRKVFQEKGWL